MNMTPPVTSIRIGTLLRQGASPAESLRAVLPFGFESFQVNFWRTLGGMDLVREAAETREVLAQSGTIISSLAIFGNPLGDEEEDRATLDGWRECIEHAREFGTDLVCGFTGRLRGRSVPESLPRFREVFGELALRAADCGVRLAFENCWTGGSWASGDYNLATNPEAWEMIFDALPFPHLGLEWEPGHLCRQLIDPLPTLKTWAPRIFHVHGKDAVVHRHVIRAQGVFGSERFAQERLPGFGESDWTAIMHELHRGGYRGCIDIEGWHDPVYRGDLELEGQRRALEHLQRCREAAAVLIAGEAQVQAS